MAELRLCGTADVAPGAARRFDVDDRRLCVVHLPGGGGGAWHVVDDECSHADYSLSEGDVWVEECEIECPKHGSTFDLRTGEPQALPATEPVPVYEVKVHGDDVVVTLP
jgi:3-phenylpropionate/trans-cinnamate dioxygenase ferredoxin component